MKWILIVFTFALFSLPRPTTAQSYISELDIIHDERVTYANWDNTYTYILTTSEDGTIRLSSVLTGEQVWQISHTASINGASWSHDGNRIVAWDDTNLLIINAQTGNFAIEPEDLDKPNISDALWKRDDSAILLYGDTFAQIITLGDGLALGDMREFGFFGDGNTLSFAQWNRDETRILTFDTNLTARVWDVDSQDEIYSFTFPTDTTGIAWSGDEMRFASWGLDSDVRLWDITENGQIRDAGSFRHSRTFVIGATWAVNDTLLLTWGADETARIWDVATGEEKMSVRHTDWVTGATLNHDGTILITWSYQFAYVWDVGTGDLMYRASHDNLVSGARLNEYETKLLTWGWDGKARVWDISR
jgi:WD40 repeat protein